MKTTKPQYKQLKKSARLPPLKAMNKHTHTHIPKPIKNPRNISVGRYLKVQMKCDMKPKEK